MAAWYGVISFGTRDLAWCRLRRKSEGTTQRADVSERLERIDEDAKAASE
jgi:hypothetical protein